MEAESRGGAGQPRMARRAAPGIWKIAVRRRHKGRERSYARGPYVLVDCSTPQWCRLTTTIGDRCTNSRFFGLQPVPDLIGPKALDSDEC